MLRFFNDLWSRVNKFQSAIGGDKGDEGGFEAKMKDAALKKFKDAYLARALSR